MSESRNRDAAVDRWLRRTLTPVLDVPSTEACLEPDEMAAWIDRQLTGSALAAADAHMANCPRCQAIAATVARTETIAEWATPERRSPWRWLTWAVPLTAAATVAMLVIAERRQPPPAPQTRVDAPQAAESRAALPPTPPASGNEVNSKVLRDAKKDAKEEAAASNRTRSEAAAPSAPAAPPAATAPAPRQQAKAAQEKPARADELDQLSALSRLAQTGVLEIRSPDPAVRWRVTGAVVQRTVDAGSTWAAIAADITPQMTAGAAPSPAVCWLAGREGVVWLSTDGGATWYRAASPVTTDLSAIRATDARNAVVTTADGREFVTTDGGRTWLRRDLQGILSAPF